VTRGAENMPADPDIAATLSVIERALAGEAVAEDEAQLARLALDLRAERPTADAGFLAALDARVAQRFADGTVRARGRLGLPGRRARSRQAAAAGLNRPRQVLAMRRRRTAASATIAALAICLALAMAIVNGWQFGRSGRNGVPSAASSHARTPASESRPAARTSFQASSSANVSGGRAQHSSAGPARTPGPSNAPAVAPATILALSTSPGDLRQVTEAALAAIARSGGIVLRSSTGTGRGGRYVQIQARVPTANSGSLLRRLAHLDHARLSAPTTAGRRTTRGPRTSASGHAGGKTSSTTHGPAGRGPVSYGEVRLTIRAGYR
jgi:hypothetical protein